ncbi:MAG: hypothetical protein ABSD08_18330 [Xanthobacteraceae bacterium]|jgi:hypothetical protein
MKLYETFGKRGFHTSIATSFGIDFDAYENVMLARFRGAGCYNNLLVTDAGMLSLALEGGGQLPRHAGRTYTVTPSGGRGVFHPKIVLQLGRAAARMIVSSANVTAAGLAGNLEVAGLVETEDMESGEARLIAAGWTFVSRFVDQNLEGVRRQVEWMQARTPWLRDVEPADDIVKLSDGTEAAFLGSGAPAGIGSRFLAALAGEKVRRLIVVSPYWDDDLASFKLLLDRADPAEACLLLDHGRHVFPADAIAKRHQKRMKLIDYKAKDAARFVHAKLIIAQTAKRDHVLYGSANCTVAALGNDTFGGANAEACLYRRLPAAAAIEALGLSDVLKRKPLRLEDFESAEPPEEIPLDQVAGRSPGQFTSMFETLIWTPPAAADTAKDRIELLGRDGELLSTGLRRLSDSEYGTLRFQLLGKERPAFARVRRRDGSLSAPAIVTLLDELRDAVRDARTRRIDAALEQLDGETDLGLWLLETLNDLEAAETALAGREGAPVRRLTAKRKDDEPAPPERKLSYEQFMAGRRLRSEIEGLTRNSLAGSHVSHIRGFLNRLLGVGANDPNLPEEEDAAHKGAFDRGDETGNAEDALEGGVEFSKQPPDTQAPSETEEERAKRAATQRRANREQLIDAVADLSEVVREKAEAAGLRCVDLLRLRAILMILASAGWDGKTPTKNLLQVLPEAGDVEGAWPRLLGKALFAHFGGPRSAITTLVLDDIYDQIPDDILECWASCIWAIQVTIAAASRHPEYASLARVLESLRGSIYRVIALREDEMQDARILRVLDALSKRFGEALGCDTAAILTSHRLAVNALMMPATLRAGAS